MCKKFQGLTKNKKKAKIYKEAREIMGNISYYLIVIKKRHKTIHDIITEHVKST